MTRKAIIWLRNDLRLADNRALSYAIAQNYEILFLYILDEDGLGSASKWFLHQVLNSFATSLKEQHNASLVLETGKTSEVLEELVRKYEIDSLLWNRVYEPKAIARDSKLKSFFKEQGLEVRTFNSSLLFEPSQILNLQGSYYKVFTPFWKRCQNELKNIDDPIPLPKEIKALSIKESESLKLAELKLLPNKPNWAKGWDVIYDVSEDKAHEIASDFMQNKMANYQKARNFPGLDETSKLSPYLHFGLISPRQIYYKTLPYHDNTGLKSFLTEIGWREFCHHMLYHFPGLATKNFKEKFDNFPWLNDQQNLQKWQQGRTGFPIIDAGMRQLWHTGWMHNRVRMIVASFLTKNLLIDWRIGAAWFNDCLVDADLASNSASWQWVAGSGADAAPYFRIFNPTTQSERFDPEGDYIRKWVPELADLDVKGIHSPTDRSEYVEPIIDLKSSRNRALELYKSLK